MFGIRGHDAFFWKGIPHRNRHGSIEGTGAGSPSIVSFERDSSRETLEGM